MEDKKIYELVSKYQMLVNNPSIELFNEVFSLNEHCTEIAIVEQYKTRESIYEDFIIGRLHKRFSTIELIAEDVSVNIINDDLAIVIFKYHTECLLRDTNEPAGIQGLETQVIVKENNEWRILHVHYSKL